MFNKQNLFTKHQENLAERKPSSTGATPSLTQSGPTGGSLGSGNASTTPTHNSTSSMTSSTPLYASQRETQTSTAVSKAADSAPQENGQESGSRLIVGPDVKLKGAEILDCDTLVVEGRVEATMDSRVIRIAEEGSFSGKVGIDIAEIFGRFDGELTARQQLIIHATGRVSGTIRYGKILIEEGGELSGDVKSLAHGDNESSAKIKPVVVSSNS